MYVSLVLSIIACLCAGTIKKYWADRYPENQKMLYLFNGGVSIVCSAVLIGISGFKTFHFSLFTLVLGILFGLITALCNIFSMKALECGDFSYTTVIGSLSTIIPALSGMLFWNEKITFIQAVGCVFMLICFVCSAEIKKDDKKTSPIWFLYVGLTFVLTGLIGVLQKWHQSTQYADELDGFLICAFLISFLYSMGGLIISLAKGKSDVLETKTKFNKKTFLLILILIVLSGVCGAANNKINLYLSGVMDSAVFFPTVNGANIILSVMVALILFHEKPSKKQWIGMLFGTIAVILLCNPF